MTEIELLEQSVDLGKAAERLLEHPDFQKVCIKAFEDKLMEIGYNMYHLEGKREADAMFEQRAIGFFMNHVMTAMHDGRQAAEQMEDFIAEVDNV